MSLIGDLAAQATPSRGGRRGRRVRGAVPRSARDRLLAAATDGVGTKLEIARSTGRLDTVGIDLVAMCADDVVCTGAEPLFFLDYLAVGKVEPGRVAAIVEGVAEGCRRAGCALLGGETAEHPGTMPDDQFDLAGFCVGVVDEADLLGPARVREGDVLVGLASSGLHANGYSLVRSALLGAHARSTTPPPELGGRSLADELLEPCAIYAPAVLALARERARARGRPHHRGRVPRERAAGAAAGPRRDRRAGRLARAAGLRARAGAAGATDADMFATFNMGIGMVLVVAPDRRRARAGGRPGPCGVPDRHGRRRGRGLRIA